MHEAVIDDKQIGEAFQNDGGSTRLDKMLGGNLGVVLDALNDNMRAQTG